MRTNKTWASLMAIALVIGGLTFSSCKKDEEPPVPEEVVNPLDEVVYYIRGAVTSANVALSDVTVTCGTTTAKTDAKGEYLLKLTQKGTYEVSFSKTDYITIQSSATIAATAEKGSTVLLSQELTKRAEPVTVEPQKETVIEASQEVTVNVPAGAVTQSTDITITPYTPAPDEKIAEETSKVIDSNTAGSVSTAVALSSLVCEPDGTVFEQPVVVKLKAEATNNVYFTSARHFINGEDKGDATFNANDKTYEITLTGFSIHEVKVPVDIAMTPTSENLLREVIDNIGQTKKISKTLTYTMQQGWTVVSKTDGVTGDIEKKLMASVTNTFGGASGITTSAIESAVEVSGDTKLTISFDQAEVNYVFSVATNMGTEKITVKKYNAVKFDMKKETGTMRPDHN